MVNKSRNKPISREATPLALPVRGTADTRRTGTATYMDTAIFALRTVGAH